MQIQSVRFSEEQWALIQEVAQRSGVAAGQFVRESAIAHAMTIAAQQGGIESARLWLEALTVVSDPDFDLGRLEAAYRVHMGSGITDGP